MVSDLTESMHERMMRGMSVSLRPKYMVINDALLEHARRIFRTSLNDKLPNEFTRLYRAELVRALAATRRPPNDPQSQSWRKHSGHWRPGK